MNYLTNGPTTFAVWRFELCVCQSLRCRTHFRRRVRDFRDRGLTERWSNFLGHFEFADGVAWVHASLRGNYSCCFYSKECALMGLASRLRNIFQIGWANREQPQASKA